LIYCRSNRLSSFAVRLCQLQSQSNRRKITHITYQRCTLCSRQWALYSVRRTFYLHIGVHYNHTTAENERSTFTSSPHPRTKVSKDEYKWTTAVISLFHRVLCHERLYRLPSTTQLCYLLLILRNYLY